MQTVAKEKNIILILLAVIIMASILPFLPYAYSISLLIGGFVIFLALKKIEWVIYFLVLYIPCEPFLLKFANDEVYPFLKYGAEILIFLLFAAAVGKRIWDYCKIPQPPLPKGEIKIPQPLLQKGEIKPPLLPFCKRGEFRQKGEKFGWYIKTPIDKPLAVFIFITAVSAILNLENPMFWIFGLRQLFRFALLYYAIIYSRLSKEKVKKAVILLLTVLIFQASIGLGQAIIGKKADEFLLPDKVRKINDVISPDYVEQSWSSGQRVFAAMGRYDRLGTFMCLVMLLAIGLAVEAKSKKNRNILIAAVLIALPAFILTYSRMSWIGLMIGMIFIGIIIKKNKKFIFIMAAGAVLFSLYIFLYVSNNNVKLYRLADKYKMAPAERFLSLFSPVELKGSYRGYGRLYFIINTPAKVIKNYPLFGAGLGRYGSGVAYALNNTAVYDELRMPFGVQDKNGMIDNNWFSIWGETGTLGLLAFGAIIFYLFKDAYLLYKKTDDNFMKGLSLGFMAVILAIFIQGFLGQYFEIRPLAFSFWVIGGIVILLKQENVIDSNTMVNKNN